MSCSKYLAYVFICALISADAGPTFAKCLITYPEKNSPYVEAITEYGELKLSDGKILLPAGLSFPNKRELIEAIQSILIGNKISLLAIDHQTDRWGRYRGHFAIERTMGYTTLPEYLIAKGVALVNLDEINEQSDASRSKSSSARILRIPTACVDHLLALEEQAKRNFQGVWKGDQAFPLQARNSKLLQRFEGKFVVVEGKILSIGERKTMTFLNFGPLWKSDFSVIIQRKDWEKMIKEGITAAKLQEKWVRIRGEIFLRGGLDGSSHLAPAMQIVKARSFTFLNVD